MDSHIKSLMFEQESDILLDEGIHYIYVDDEYMDVDGNRTPFVNGKVASKDIHGLITLLVNLDFRRVR